MIQPDDLKRNEPLRWPTGSGTDVWEVFGACTTGDLAAVKRATRRGQDGIVNLLQQQGAR